MKFPLMDPTDANARLAAATADMAAMKAELIEIKELLKILISTQYLLAGLDSPPDI